MPHELLIKTKKQQTLWEIKEKCFLSGKVYLFKSAAVVVNGEIAETLPKV